MSEFKFEPASRVGIIPLLAVWGSTGSGKTNSALLLARGLAGNGRLGVIDTEGRRASYYADSIPGGFFALNFDAPYSPERYVEAVDLLEKSADVGVIDSCSHCWEGPDGVLDLHEQMLDRMLGDRRDDWSERQRMNWPAWREPKARFKLLRNRLLQVKIPLILCFRGSIKTRMVKDDRGRNTVMSDTTTTPIFDGEFIFQTHAAMELFQKDGIGGFVRFPMPFAKTSHPSLRACLPKAEVEQLTIAHGAALAQWCNNPTRAAAQPTAPVRKALTSHEILKKTLWEMSEPLHHGNVKALSQILWDENLISDTETLEGLTEARLSQVIENIGPFVEKAKAS